MIKNAGKKKPVSSNLWEIAKADRRIFVIQIIKQLAINFYSVPNSTDFIGFDLATGSDKTVIRLNHYPSVDCVRAIKAEHPGAIVLLPNGKEA